MSAQTAAAANEYAHAIGQDVYTASELAEWEETEAAEGDDVSERWEREGRAEMFFMLDLGDY